MSSNDSSAPIFILGITPRCGTNLLFNLLRLHPDCGVPEPIWEDYLLEPTHLLLQYVRRVHNWWESAKEPWVTKGGLEGELCNCLGQGLLSFLQSRVGTKRLLTKTPNVSNLDQFFAFFPEAYLLILVRDGRDVVESGVQSFGWDRDGFTRGWAHAAQTILEFDQAHRERGLRYMIVRYEDLHLDLDNELRQILAFLDLDSVAYDFEAAHELPVYGSSTLGATEDWVHWKPMSRTAGFNPIGKWSDWSKSRHERFNWLAGKYLVAFGYKERSYAAHQSKWVLYNRIVDLVQRHKPYRLMPAFLWKLTKRSAYQLLRLQDGAVGDDARADERPARTR
jgi:hypothetical protein